MNKLFIGTKNLILSKQRTLISSTLIVALTIIFSRFFGFLRYRVLATYFTKADLDIFFASFRIPDIVFEILITGALTSSLIPIFIKYQKNKEELGKSISSIINLISLVLFVLILVLTLLADKIFPYITPGFTPAQIESVILYSRILLVGQLPFLVFGNFLTGIGQANKIFIISAITPIVYNLVIIATTVLFAKTFYLFAPIIGVVVGAALLFLIQLPLFFTAQFVYQPVIKFTRGVRDFFRMIVPRVVTVITAQIDATIDLTLATILGPGSYTIFYLAQHLQLLPVSVIGIAFGQASLPYLSEVYQEKKYSEFKRIISESILSILFLTLPIMSFFIFARTPLVRLFFGGARFDWEATVQTAITLSYFALSIPAHSIYYLITRCFYAFLDSKTPFIVSIFSIITNIILSLLFIFVFHLPVWSLAISFSIAITLNVLLLLIILSRKIHGLNALFILIESIKVLTATFISSFFVYWLMKLLDGLVLDTSRTINVFLLLLIGSLAHLLFYLFLSWMLNVKEFSLVMKLARKAKEYKRRVVEIYTGIE